MNKPWISLITLDYPPNRGGVAVYLSSLVCEANGEIEVIVDREHVHSSAQDERRREIFFRQSWPRWWPLVGLCRKEGERQRIIFVSHIFPVGTAAWIAHLFFKTRYAVLFHGLDLRLAHGVWKRFLLQEICRNAEALICNSEATKRELLSLVPGSVVHVLTPGVEDIAYPARREARRRLSIGDDGAMVLSIARLVPRKGIDRTLEAMSRMQRERDVVYVVIGDGTDRERLERIARERRVSVRWIPNADDDEKRLWLAAADIFVLPVREERGDMEGFGIVYLEAAKAGIPSIAGKSGGAPEAVRHERTGFVVNPRSVDEIHAAMTRLLDDEDLRRRYGDEARRRAEAEFRWADRWAKLGKILGRTN